MSEQRTLRSHLEVFLACHVTVNKKDDLHGPYSRELQEKHTGQLPRKPGKLGRFSRWTEKRKSFCASGKLTYRSIMNSCCILSESASGTWECSRQAFAPPARVADKNEVSIVSWLTWNKLQFWKVRWGAPSCKVAFYASQSRLKLLPGRKGSWQSRPQLNADGSMRSQRSLQQTSSGKDDSEFSSCDRFSALLCRGPSQWHITMDSYDLVWHGMPSSNIVKIILRCKDLVDAVSNILMQMPPEDYSRENLCQCDYLVLRSAKIWRQSWLIPLDLFKTAAGGFWLQLLV